MAEGLHSPRVISFGIFEVDLQTGELRKAGLKLKLTGQPFQVLAILLERPAEVVTREELQKRLWPDTFVDIDHNLNTAINKIREALDDSAESPRFVETLPRRGYRFIGSVNRESAIASAADSERLKGETASGKTAPVDAVGPTAYGKLRWLGLLAAVIVVLAIVGTFVWLRLPHAPPRVLATTQLTGDGMTKTRLLTDGSRLYITETKRQSQFLVQASVAGGETSRIPTPFPNVNVLDISHDHSQFLVVSLPGNQPAEFWALPLPSGPPRRIADVTGENGKWSPDGRQLVFTKGENVYLAKADGTDARKLFTLPNVPADPRFTNPRFSPDSTRIRFNIWKDNTRSIWEIRTDGTNLQLLLPGWRNPPNECCGVWSADGRYFFFLSITPFGGNIWALQESNSPFRKYSSRLFQLTAGPMLFGAMTPSPDGKKLFADGRIRRGELIRYDARRREFVPFLSGIWATDVNFSRDGKWVAYVSYPEGTLWRSRVDGSDRLQLTNPPVFAALPRWSPDGTQIAFGDIQLGRLWKTWLVSTQGGAAKEMLPENRVQGDAQWSPDGKQMVFDRSWWEKPTIQLLDVDSKQVSIIPGSQGLYSPRWSPDGRYLAALTSDFRKIVIFDFESQKWTDWVSGPGWFAYPSWSRDGKYLYFGTEATETPGYYRVQLGQTRPELVVNWEDLHKFVGPLGDWSGITPDGSPLFVRDTGTDEIYALDLELP